MKNEKKTNKVKMNQANQVATQQECNYQNDYYGDQVCIKKNQ